MRPGFGRPSRDRHLERVDDDLGLQVGAHRPTDDPAQVVPHRSQVEPAQPARTYLMSAQPSSVVEPAAKSRSTGLPVILSGSEPELRQTRSMATPEVGRFLPRRDSAINVMSPGGAGTTWTRPSYRRSTDDECSEAWARHHRPRRAAR